jgi:hypothetical protein
MQVVFVTRYAKTTLHWSPSLSLVLSYIELFNSKLAKIMQGAEDKLGQFLDQDI